MKYIKIIGLFILLANTCFGQDLNSYYGNSITNPDFSSTVTFGKKTLITSKDFIKWVNNNMNKFESVNRIKVATEKRWFWGSTKTVILGFEFVKPENANYRIAYYAELSKKNAEECRRQQEANDFWRGTLIGLGLGGAKYIWDNKTEIASWVSRNWGNSSYDASNTSSDVPSNETSKQSIQNNAPSDGKHIEFREERVSKCSQGYIRIFKVYKNGQYHSTINVGLLGDGKWYRDCPKDQLLPQTTVLQSKMTLKEFLIDCYSGDDGKADSYSLKTLSP